MKYTNEQLLEIFTEDLRYSKKNLSVNTIDTYLKHINYLLAFLEDKNIFDITEEDIYDYLDSIKSLSHSSYNKSVSAFRTLYNTLRRNRTIKKDYQVVNPAIDIELYKTEQVIKTPLNKVEREMLIKYAKNSRERAMFTVMMDCGLRVHEIIDLTLEQYENRIDGDTIILTTTKGSKQAYMVLNQRCIDAIELYLLDRKQGCDKLFVSNQGNKMDRGNLSRTIKKVAERSGAFSEERIKQLNNHLFRHTTADVLLNEKKKPLHVVQAVMRHSSPQTTQIYAKTDLASIREAMVG